MSDELTIEECLKELRKMFPKGTNQVDYGASDGEAYYVSRADIVVSKAGNGAKRFRADTLIEAMAQVRVWHQSQQQEQSK